MISTKVIPCCFNPTKVIFIDDNPEYLKSIEAVLSEKTYLSLFYENPRKALQFLNEEYKPDPFTGRWLDQPDATTLEHKTLDVNIRDIYKEVYNKERFNQISTIIVDFDMPEMNGLEFCSALENKHIQKILLTGAADEHLAVEAFNEGIIQRFLQKQDSDIFSKLEDAIYRSQIRYFNLLSSIVHETLLSQSNSPTAIQNADFIKAFQKIIQDKNIVEFFQFEASGSFLMLDNKGQDYGLFTHSLDRIEADSLEIADDPEGEIPDSVKESILNKSKLICYHNRDAAELPPPSEWSKYLYDAQCVEGKTPFYYALAPQGLDLDRENILSFSSFAHA